MANSWNVNETVEYKFKYKFLYNLSFENRSYVSYDLVHFNTEQLTFTQTSPSSIYAHHDYSPVQSSPALGSDMAVTLSCELDGSQWAGSDIWLAWPKDSASHSDVAELQNTHGVGKN